MPLLIADPEPLDLAAESCCLEDTLSGKSCRFAGVTGLLGGEVLLTGPLAAVPNDDFRDVDTGTGAVVTTGPGTACFCSTVAGPFLRWLLEVCPVEAHCAVPGA